MRRLALGCAGAILIVVVFFGVIAGLARLGIKEPGSVVGDFLDNVTGTRRAILIRKPSPDGQFVAVASVIYSADSEIGVAVQTADESDTFIILGIVNRGAEEREVGLNWTGPRTLQVKFTGDPGMVDYEDVRNWRGIHIEYVQ